MSLGTELGVWISPGLGQAYPELRDGIMMRVFGDRVASVPWVPQNWLASVRALQANNPTGLVRIGPAKLLGSAVRAPDAPSFADTQAKLDWWQSLFDASNAAVGKYAAQQQAAGKAELDKLYANAAFWNTGLGATAITVATTIRDLPKNAVGAVLDGAGSVAGGVLKKLLGSWIVWVGLVGVAGFVAWKFGLIKVRKGK